VEVRRDDLRDVPLRRGVDRGRREREGQPADRVAHGEDRSGGQRMKVYKGIQNVPDPYAEMAELLADKLGNENLLKLWDLIESDSQDRLFDRLSDVIVRRGLAPVEDEGDINSPEDPR
jgi:hypothetical protein